MPRKKIVVPLRNGRRSEISMNSDLTPAQCRTRGVCETCGGFGSLGFVGVAEPVEGPSALPGLLGGRQ